MVAPVQPTITSLTGAAPDGSLVTVNIDFGTSDYSSYRIERAIFGSGNWELAFGGGGGVQVRGKNVIIPDPSQAWDIRVQSSSGQDISTGTGSTGDDSDLSPWSATSTVLPHPGGSGGSGGSSGGGGTQPAPVWVYTDFAAELHPGVSVDYWLPTWVQNGYQYTFSLVGGTLPPGLAISGNDFSGTPTEPGDFTFTLRAANSMVHSDHQFTITVSEPFTGKPTIDPHANFQIDGSAVDGYSAYVNIGSGFGLVDPANATLAVEQSTDGGATWRDCASGDSNGVSGILFPVNSSVQARVRIYDSEATPNFTYAAYIPDGDEDSPFDYDRKVQTIDTTVHKRITQIQCSTVRASFNPPALRTTVVVHAPSKSGYLLPATLKLALRVFTQDENGNVTDVTPDGGVQVATVPTAVGTYTFDITGHGLAADSFAFVSAVATHPEVSDGQELPFNDDDEAISISGTYLAPGTTVAVTADGNILTVTAHLKAGDGDQHEKVFHTAELHTSDNMGTSYVTDRQSFIGTEGTLVFTDSHWNLGRGGDEVGLDLYLYDAPTEFQPDGAYIDHIQLPDYVSPWITAQELDAATTAPAVASVVQAPYSRFRFDARFLAPIPDAVDRDWRAQFKVGDGDWQFESGAIFTEATANGITVTTPATATTLRRDYRFIATHPDDTAVVVYVSQV